MRILVNGEPVATDARAPVAQAGHLLGRQLVPTVGVGHQHEVVLGAVSLDEGVLAHGAIVSAAVGSGGRRRGGSPRHANVADGARERLVRPMRDIRMSDGL